MEQDDGKVPEIKPCFVKSATPAVDEPINDCAAVQLHANCIKDDSSVDWKGLKGVSHNLESVSTLKYWHAGVNLGITDADKQPTWIVMSSCGTNVISWTCWAGAEAIMTKEGLIRLSP
jgi:hypothetical protein